MLTSSSQTITKPEQSFRTPISPSKRAYLPEDTASESPSKGQARYRLGNLLSGIRTRDIIQDNEEAT